MEATKKQNLAPR